jgi:hypothetical protein
MTHLYFFCIFFLFLCVEEDIFIAEMEVSNEAKHVIPVKFLHKCLFTMDVRHKKYIRDKNNL